MSTNKIIRLLLATTAGSLMLGAASGPSFAQHHPVGPHVRPPCDASCQANKAMPPAKLQPAKPTAAPNTGGGKTIRPQ
jgi:hypothetical protein